MQPQTTINEISWIVLCMILVWYYAVIERLRGQCRKSFGLKHYVRTELSEVRTRSWGPNIFLHWSSNRSIKALLYGVKTLYNIFELFWRMFTQKTYFVSISFSHLNLSHFINEKLRGYITWLYQSWSIRLVQTGEEPIRLRRCQSTQPYFRIMDITHRTERMFVNESILPVLLSSITKMLLLSFWKDIVPFFRRQSLLLLGRMELVWIQFWKMYVFINQYHHHHITKI